MGVSTTSLAARAQRLVVAGLAAATLSVSLVAGVANASTTQSAAMSPFCKTLTTYHPKTPPAGSNYQAYRTWAKNYLPFFQKLASQAPNASSKVALNEMVQMIKAEAGTSNQKALGAYIYAHRLAWTKGWKALTAAIMGCVTSLY